MLDKETKPDYETLCSDCGNVPTLPLTALCAVHTFDNLEERKSWEEDIKSFKGSKQGGLI